MKLTRRSLVKSATLLPTSSGMAFALDYADHLAGYGQTLSADESVSRGDNRFAPLCSKWLAPDLPAIWLSVGDRSREIASACDGYRNISGLDHAAIGDRIGYGSITKVFTALLVASLVDDGLLDYSTPAASYLPGFREFFVGDKSRITLAQLVSHRAGLARASREPTGIYKNGSEYRLQYAKNGLSVPLLHVPGTADDYSNIGLTLAAVVTETITGKPWEFLMQERIFHPLGLDSIETFPIVDRERVHSYELSPQGSLRDTSDLEMIQRNRFGPAGAYRGTATDLMKFCQAFLSPENMRTVVRNRSIYDGLVQVEGGATFTRAALATNVNRTGMPYLTMNGALTAGKNRSYAALRINMSRGVTIALLTNICCDTTDHKLTALVDDIYRVPLS